MCSTDHHPLRQQVLHWSLPSLQRVYVIHVFRNDINRENMPCIINSSCFLVLPLPVYLGTAKLSEIHFYLFPSFHGADGTYLLYLPWCSNSTDT